MPCIVVPPELISLDQWVCWKFANDRKIPYNPVDGKPASTTDPETWSSFMTACNSNDFAGIGFVFTKNDQYVGIDIDNCVVDGILDKPASKIGQLMRSYTELSQSGNGIHIIVKGEKPGEKCRAGNVEMYDSGRYFIMTGHRKSSLDIHTRQAEIAILYRTMFPEQVATPTKPRHKPIATQTDIELVSKILMSHQYNTFRKLWVGHTAEYPSHSEADAAMCALLFSHTNDPDQIDRIFRKSGLMRKKWDAKRGTRTYGEITISNASHW